MTHCSQHTLSQTAQNLSQFSYLDAPGELDIPPPGSRIMTYVEHLNIVCLYPILLIVVLVVVVKVVRERDVA